MRQKLGDQDKPADVVRGGLVYFSALGAVSALAGLIAYRSFVGRPDWEGFWAFFAGVLFSLLPFILLGRQYFIQKLKHAPQAEEPAQHRYGVKDEFWTEELKFVFSIYSTAVAAAVMGFLVWCFILTLCFHAYDFVRIVFHHRR
jgi:hypothetical protein